MKIRKATIDDIDGLVDLNKQIGDCHYDNAPLVFTEPSAKERAFLIDALNNPQRVFFVAVNNNQILGFLTATITRNETIPFLTSQPICRVGTVVIDSMHRRQGLGKALLAECKKWASADGANEVRLEVMEFNQAAQAFYERLGFHTQSRTMSQVINN